MRLSKLLTLTLCGLVLPLLAVAQRGPGGGGGGGGPGGPGGGRGPNFDRTTQDLAQQLQLTDAQKPQYDSLVQQHRDAVEQAANNPQMRELFQQMRDARQANDDAKVAELQTQMQKLRDEMQKPLNAFFDDVATILTPEQKQTLTDYRARMQQQMGGGMNPQRLLQTLPEQLKLTDEQKPQFDKLAEELRGKLQQQRGQMQDMRQLFQDLRDAQQAGDEAKVAEIQKQIDARNAERNKPVQEFVAALEPILTAEQKTKLHELVAQMTPPARGEVSPRTLMQAIQRLTLTDEQRTQVRGILAQYQEAYGKLAADDAAGRDKLNADVKAQLKAVLTPDQQQQLDQSLTGGGRGGRGGAGGGGAGGGAGGGRGGRGGRGGGGGGGGNGGGGGGAAGGGANGT